jgi:hypothetical protein
MPLLNHRQVIATNKDMVEFTATKWLAKHPKPGESSVHGVGHRCRAGGQDRHHGVATGAELVGNTGTQVHTIALVGTVLPAVLRDFEAHAAV